MHVRTVCFPSLHHPVCDQLIALSTSLLVLIAHVARIILTPLSALTSFLDIHILSMLSMACPLKSEDYAPWPIPSLGEFEHLWSLWDTATRHMLPEAELSSKPIKLRNCCLFYLGHIPSFLDTHIARATDNRPTEPSYYKKIFERGIDPDVDNPEDCHAHSEIPDTWPPAEEILAYQERVRNRVRSAYAEGSTENSRILGRALWIGFEHEGMYSSNSRTSSKILMFEAMHLETFLYMLVQSDKIRAPPGATPDFKALAQQAQKDAVPNKWIGIPASTVDVGMDDPENDLGPERYFGWDNEKPSRQVEVPTFEAKARPITNQEYAQYLDRTHRSDIPASWASSPDDFQGGLVTKVNGYEEKQSNSVYLNGHGEPLTDAYLKGKSIRTVYGLVPLEYALDWPVFASFDQLSGCAKWMNGRIPTADEARSIYTYADNRRTKEAEGVQVQTISAVNG